MIPTWAMVLLGLIAGLVVGAVLGHWALLSSLRQDGWRVELAPLPRQAAGAKTRKRMRRRWRVGIVSTPARHVPEVVQWLAVEDSGLTTYTDGSPAPATE